MPSWKPGKPTTVVVGDITPQGFRLRVDDEDFWVSFERYPMLRDAPPEVLQHDFEVFPSGIWWEALDEGIEFEALRHPERYPLIARR